MVTAKQTPIADTQKESKIYQITKGERGEKGNQGITQQPENS